MRGKPKLFVVGGLLSIAALALIVSPWADSSPDGLARVAEKVRFAETERDHDLGDSPFARYELEGIENDRLSTGAAGALGAVATFGVTVGALSVVRRKRSPGRSPEAER